MMSITSTAMIAGLLTLGVSSTALADDSDAAPYLGSYRNVSVTQSDRRITHAIERATDDMAFLVRPVARKLLKAVNPASANIRISLNNGEITTEFDGLRYVAEASGKPRRNVDPDGANVDVSYRWDGHTMHARYKAAEGEKVYHFTPDPERRTLKVDVTVRSPRLTTPVSYSLAFVAGS